MKEVRTIASAKPVVMTRKERIIPILIVLGIVVVSLILLIGG